MRENVLDNSVCIHSLVPPADEWEGEFACAGTDLEVPRMGK